MSPRLSVIIVNWNTRALLTQCLESLAATAREVAFETIVVDNGSSDGSSALVRDGFSNVRLIENHENWGFARANNVGIRSSRSPLVMLLNSDTLVKPGALVRVVEFMEATPQAGVVGVKLLNPDGSFQASYNDFPSALSELVTTAGLARWVYGPYFPSHSPDESRNSRQVDWVGGACLTARRAAIDQVSLLNEEYWMYGEEMEWCYRFNRAGWQVWYLADAEITHLGGQSGVAIADKKLFWLSESRLRLLRHYTPGVTLAVIKLAVRVVAFCKTLAWLGIGLIGRRRVAQSKAQANWRVATWKGA